MSIHRLFEIIQLNENELLTQWLRLQNENLAARRDRISETQLQANSQNFIMAFREALSTGGSADTSRPEWGPLRKELDDLAPIRAFPDLIRAPITRTPIAIGSFEPVWLAFSRHNPTVQ